MQFLFDADLIQESVLPELQYLLEMISLDMPILSKVVLSPMDHQMGWKHYSRLENREQELSAENLRLLLAHAQKLPNLEGCLEAIKKSQLDITQAHLFFQYLKEHESLEKSEKKFTGKPSITLDSIRRAIDVLLDEDKRGFPRSAHYAEIHELDRQFQAEVIDMENQVKSLTGWSMYYPLSREVIGDLPETVKNCSLLRAQPMMNGWLVDFALTPKALTIKKNLDSVLKTVDAEVEEKLSELNKKLLPFAPSFQESYQERKQIVLDWVYIQFKKNQMMCWPQDSDECQFEGLFLPLMKTQMMSKALQKYQAIICTLKKGASALFGPNMSGKTSSLRAIYFALTCIQLGLPVPARTASLSFPEHVHVHFRSNGVWEKNLSSFTEELAFFKTKFQEKCYVLMDELFHSTNPSSGVTLSKIFLSELSTQNLYFITTTHYLELLDDQSHQTNLLEMTEQFQLIPMSKGHAQKNRDEQLRKPMQIALDFGLPTGFKKRMTEWMKDNG